MTRLVRDPEYAPGQWASVSDLYPRELPLNYASPFGYRYIEGSLQVNDGCNRGSGHWAAEGTGIRVSDVILTKMACASPGVALEAAVLAVLNQGTMAAEIKASTLTLQAGARGLQLQGG